MQLQHHYTTLCYHSIQTAALTITINIQGVYNSTCSVCTIGLQTLYNNNNNNNNNNIVTFLELQIIVHTLQVELYTP